MRPDRPVRVRAAFALALALAAAALAGCASSPSSMGPRLSPARITQVVSSPDRSIADRENDLRRKPEQMLNFIGVRPGMQVLDLSTGGGYTTELLARAVGPSGVVYAQARPRPADDAAVRPAQAEGAGGTPPQIDPAGAQTARPRTSQDAIAERVRHLQEAGILAAPIIFESRPFEDPLPPELAEAKFDLVTIMFNYHDLGWLAVDRARMNAAVFRALKPGGLFVVADHAGRAGTGITESGTLHRVEESLVRSEIQAAGFQLQDEGFFLRNPADPRDRNTPNPPQPKDEFVLKFVKP